MVVASTLKFKQSYVWIDEYDMYVLQMLNAIIKFNFNEKL